MRRNVMELQPDDLPTQSVGATFAPAGGERPKVGEIKFTKQDIARVATHVLQVLRTEDSAGSFATSLWDNEIKQRTDDMIRAAHVKEITAMTKKLIGMYQKDRRQHQEAYDKTDKTIEMIARRVDVHDGDLATTNTRFDVTNDKIRQNTATMKQISDNLLAQITNVSDRLTTMEEAEKLTDTQVKTALANTQKQMSQLQANFEQRLEVTEKGFDAAAQIQQQNIDTVSESIQKYMEKAAAKDELYEKFDRRVNLIDVGVSEMDLNLTNGLEAITAFRAELDEMKKELARLRPR